MRHQQPEMEWFSRPLPVVAQPEARVLVWDDDPERREVILRALGGLGLEARSYTTEELELGCQLVVASIAPKVAPSGRRAPPDAVEGPEALLRRSRESGILTPFILYGPELSRRRRRSFDQLGGVVVFRTPVDLDDLCTAVWAMVRRTRR